MLTFEVADPTAVYSLVMYDITGAASAAFDVAGDATGDQTSFVSTLTGASVTPSASGELVLCQLGNHYNTVTGASGSGFVFDSFWDNDESIDGPENVDENDGWSHYYSASASKVSCVFTYSYATDAQQYWASVAAAFKPAD